MTLTFTMNANKNGQSCRRGSPRAFTSLLLAGLLLLGGLFYVLPIGAFAEPAETFAIGWDLNADGIADVVENYEAGELPVSPRNGQREGNAQYSYVFTGWSPEVVPVSGPAVYTATFDQVVRSYLIRADVDGDGLIEYSETLPYGTIPSFEAEDRPDTERYSFSFNGWTAEPVSVHEDAVYIAQYDCRPLTDRARSSFDVSLTVMNSTGEDQWLIIRLMDGDVCVAALPLSLPNGFNETVTFPDLRKNYYSVQICSALEDDVCFLNQSVLLTDPDTTLSMLLTGKGASATVTVDPMSEVVGLSLPRSLLRNETGDRSYSLNASVLKFVSDDVPFRETFDLLAGEKQLGMYLQLLLQRVVGEERTVTPWTTEAMTLAIRIPEALREEIGEDGMNQVTFFRVWDGRSEIISTESNASGEYFEYVDGVAILHVRGSGYYALAYERTRPTPSFCWLMILADLAVLLLIFVERRHHFMEYYLKVVISLGLTGILVLVLALRADLVSILFAGGAWLLIVWLLIGKGQPDAPRTSLGDNEGLFDAFSGLPTARSAETWTSWGQGNTETDQTDSQEKPDSKS